jgi:hypothetical protein
MKRLNNLVVILVLYATLWMSCSPLIAKVSVYTAGSSNGDSWW